MTNGWLDKVKDYVKGNPQQADSALDKVEEIIDTQTGGKYADQVDRGSDLLREKLGLPPDAAPAPADSTPAPAAPTPAPNPSPATDDPQPPSEGDGPLTPGGPQRPGEPGGPLEPGLRPDQAAGHGGGDDPLPEGGPTQQGSPTP